MTTENGMPQSDNGVSNQLNDIKLIGLHLVSVEQKVGAIFDTLMAFRKAFHGVDDPVVRHFELSIYDQLVEVSDSTKETARLLARMGKGVAQ